MNVLDEVREKVRDPRLRRLLGPVVLAVVILVCIPLFRALFLTRVEPGYLGVRQDNVFGSGISDEDLGAGYHLRIVGVHRIYRLEEHFDFLHFAEAEPLSIRTRDNNVVTLDVSIPFHIRPGEAHKIVQAGLHVGDAYKERTRNTTIGVLRQTLAEMSAPEFFDTDRRLRVSEHALAELNQNLAEFHVEAEHIYIRAVYYREEYENQQQRIQLLEQEALLDQAQEEVAQRQQLLDTYQQQTAALENARNAFWEEQLAVLERVYRVGYQPDDLDSLVAAEMAGQYTSWDLPAGDDLPPLEVARFQVDDAVQRGETRARLVTQLQTRYAADVYHFGIEGIDAQTNRRVAELEGRANALQARYDAEAERVIAEILYERDRRINELLSSSGGRALVALEAAERLEFADELVFHASSLPFVLDLYGIASRLMGEMPGPTAGAP